MFSLRYFHGYCPLELQNLTSEMFAYLIQYFINLFECVLFKVDCTEAGKETCGKHGVSGYPTLKIFRNGKFSQEYDGPRQAGKSIPMLSFEILALVAFVVTLECMHCLTRNMVGTIWLTFYVYHNIAGAKLLSN